MPFTITHDPFTIDLTDSDDNTLCGGLSYEALIDGEIISDSDVVSNIAYDASSRQFKVFSEDSDFIGSKTLLIQSKLTDFSEVG